MCYGRGLKKLQGYGALAGFAVILHLKDRLGRLLVVENNQHPFFFPPIQAALPGDIKFNNTEKCFLISIHHRITHSTQWGMTAHTPPLCHEAFLSHVLAVTRAAWHGTFLSSYKMASVLKKKGSLRLPKDTRSQPGTRLLYYSVGCPRF